LPYKILIIFFFICNISHSQSFSNAISITGDGKGFIYVLDKSKNEITKLDSNLNIIKKSGDYGWASGQFISPTYIDASSGLDIFVSDGNNYRVQRLDLNLAFISELKTNTITFNPEFQFNTPVATLIVNSNNLFVIDKDNKRIVIYQNGEKPSNSFGDFKTSPTPLIEPVKLLKDNNNNIYILDKGYNKILIFDNFGNFIKTIELDNVKTFSIFNNNLYIISGNEIFIYEPQKNAFSEKISLPENYQNKITDLLIYNSEKYFILEKNKLSYIKP